MVVVRVRMEFTRDQWKLIREVAKERGVKPRDFIRSYVMDALDQWADTVMS